MAVEKIIGSILGVYFLFDFFFWNGGLVNPSILQQFADLMTIIPS